MAKGRKRGMEIKGVSHEGKRKGRKHGHKRGHKKGHKK